MSGPTMSSTKVFGGTPVPKTICPMAIPIGEDTVRNFSPDEPPWEVVVAAGVFVPVSCSVICVPSKITGQLLIIKLATQAQLLQLREQEQ